MIGIIGAMEQEIHRLRDAMEGKEEVRYAGMIFHTGRLFGSGTALCQCSPGKVNAALCTQAMLDRFAPAQVVNCGVAGGVGDGIDLLDVVVATEVCQHDVDTTAVGDAPGYLSGLGRVMLPCNEELAGRLAAAAREAGARVHFGIVATGDQFISTRGGRERIREGFGAAAVEMEGGSVGQVCYRSGVPFGVIRCISDNGSALAPMEYPAFCAAAAERSMQIIRRFLEAL